jgi:nitroimidazol reductase NimA-like FMN-containing flavoprotein (pyridoxamine 5'-phosphate oxidase superfamily)
MIASDPVGELDPDFSAPGATPMPWADATEQLQKAEGYWLSTVRPDGRPHVTPLASVWLDGSLFFCTGPEERKAKNLERNTRVVMTTGTNTFEGLDVVVEGEAVPVKDEAKLQRVADAYAAKYPELFNFTVRDNAFHGDGGKALVFEVVATKAFGFRKGNPFSQTRWRFR